VSGFGSGTSFAATTLNSTIGDWANLVTLSMNGRMKDDGPSFGLTFYNQYYKATNVFNNFSDVRGPSANPYTEITFDSLADNYYTQVAVDPESFAEQRVQTGAAPYRTYKVNTLNASTGQALDYANYLLATYQNPRGTTYQCIIEGAAFSGTPQGGVYATYYVSGADLNNYLLLNNAVYGRLDSNKLGY